MVLGTVREESGSPARRIKVLKAKLPQEGPSGSSPLRSDGYCDDQAGGWTSRDAAKDTQGKVGKQL